MRRIFFLERSMRSIAMGAYVGVAALLAAMTPVVAHGQGAGGSAAGKVAYVNTREILRQTPGYAAAESLYNKEFTAAQEQARKLNASLDSASNDFERQSAMLNTTQRAAKRKSLDDYFQSVQQKLRGLDSTMNARERDLLEPIQKRINAVIEGVRAEGSYGIIFDVSAPNNGIVTADTSLDLTQKVIQRLK